MPGKTKEAMTKKITIFKKTVCAALLGTCLTAFVLPSNCLAQGAQVRRMLAPSLLIQSPEFAKNFPESSKGFYVEKLSEKQIIRQNLEIFFAVSSTIKGKLLKKDFKFSRLDEREFTRWYFSHPGEKLQISPRLLKKLFVNLLVMCRHGSPEVRRQAQVWMPRFAARWSIKEICLRNLLSWLDRNMNDFENVQEHVFFDFMQEYVDQYRGKHNLNDDFRYLVSPGTDDDTKLREAVSNMRLMTGLFSLGYAHGEKVLKAMIGNTRYFIGMRFGQYATSSTFVNEILIGEEQQSYNPLAGVFFRLGFDSEGAGTVRVVQIGGIRNKSEELKSFREAVGINTDKALLLALMELAKKKGFENIAGVRKEYLSCAKQISYPYIATYKSFGITRNHPLGAIRPILTPNGLLVRWEKKAEQDGSIARGLGLIKEAVDNLQEIKALYSRQEMELICQEGLTPPEICLQRAEMEASI